ncbi:MAG: tRNA 2-thiouridine(34) synthase MnmA [bacterium]
MKKVVVGLSGGVDSSVAPYLLQKKGYDVSGVMLGLEPKECGNRCCKEEPARLVCQKLGIPFEVVDVSLEFKKYVIDYFKRELEAGRTPNPCIPCNCFIKFGLFFDILDQKYPNHFLATGHYVRVHSTPALPCPSAGRRQAGVADSTRRVETETVYRLLRGKNRAKDQSYFLHTLTQEKLARLVFPLGEVESKGEVRSIAKKLGLKTAEEPESQDICFQMPKVKAKPGAIVDTSGKKLGEHKGLPFYTIGQRGGLGVSFATPLYVISKNARENSLILGPKEVLYKNAIQVKNVNLISGDYTPREFEASVAVRYHAKEVAGVVVLKSGKKATVRLEEPALSPTPGQFAVFYQGEQCLGGGIIGD